MFGFDLTESWSEARKILEEHAPCGLSSWRKVKRGWQESKSVLAAALDASNKTARRVVPFAHAITPSQLRESWTAALTYRTDEVCSVAWDEARNRLNATECDSSYLDSAKSALQRKAADLQKVRIAQAWLNPFARLSYPDEGVIPSGVQYAAWENLSSAIRPGMRLGRALAAYLRDVASMTADDASRVTDLVLTAAAVKPREGSIVLSVNPLDLLFCSEVCTYSSCHALEGCYRAGPQAYLQDPHTVVAYYYETERTWQNLDLPHKLYRQMCYVDAEHSAVALQKRYGQTLPTEAHALIRRELAGLLCRLSNPLFDSEPNWVHGKEERRATIDQGAGLAYLDATVEYVSLKQRARPRIQLAESVPCPACGDELDKADSLVCGDCAGRHSHRCEACGERLQDDDCNSNENGNCYCETCYRERYASCQDCSAEVYRDDAHTIGDDYVCDRCFARHYFVCCECENSFHDDDGTTFGLGKYCEACLEIVSAKCAECGERTCNNDLAAVDGKCYCEACCKEVCRLNRLYRRLAFILRSLHTSPAKRVALRLLWSDVLGVNLSSFAHLDNLPTTQESECTHVG